jgi:hypothetical protein
MELEISVLNRSMPEEGKVQVACESAVSQFCCMSMDIHMLTVGQILDTALTDLVA